MNSPRLLRRADIAQGCVVKSSTLIASMVVSVAAAAAGACSAGGAANSLGSGGTSSGSGGSGNFTATGGSLSVGGSAGNGGFGNLGGVGGDGGGGFDAARPTGTVTVIGPGAAPDSATKFAGADDPSAVPTIVYPADGALVPPNLNSLEIHFRPGAGQNLFEITFQAPNFQLVVYTGCTAVGGGCVYTTEQNFWSQLVAAARGLPPVSYVIRGVNAASAAAVGSSAVQKIAFAQEDITGGLYYWNTKGVIQRYDFGYPLQAAEDYLSPAKVGGGICVGCHVLSRDGKKMAFDKNLPLLAGAPYSVYDVATRKPILANGTPLAGQANFFTFSPDGGQLLASDGKKIWWRDTVSGAVVKDPVIANGTMPDWSPDGSKLVFAQPPSAGFLGSTGITDGSISLSQFANGAFAPPTKLVPFSGANNYYPAFAPDSQWIIFDRSPSNAESSGNAKPGGDGELWTISPNGGAPLRLDAANAGGANSWPKWAPGIASYHGGSVMWLTFSTPRAYGLRLANGAQVQLWMIGFDPARAAQGLDPSFPPIWFPYQDIAGGNHIAQWVAKIERQSCTKALDCDGNEVCTTDKCVPPVH